MSYQEQKTEQKSENSGEEFPLYCNDCKILVGYFILRPNSPSYEAERVLGKPETNDDEFICVKCRSQHS